MVRKEVFQRSLVVCAGQRRVKQAPQVHQSRRAVRKVHTIRFYLWSKAMLS